MDQKSIIKDTVYLKASSMTYQPNSTSRGNGGLGKVVLGYVVGNSGFPTCAVHVSAENIFLLKS